jgi:hypothetical protein
MVATVLLAMLKINKIQNAKSLLGWDSWIGISFLNQNFDRDYQVSKEIAAPCMHNMQMQIT